MRAPFESVRPALTLLAVAICMLSAESSIAGGARHGSGDVLAGRLATVEPAARRVTVVPDGAEHRVEVLVAAGAEISERNGRLSMAELVTRTGRRVRVEFRVEGERRVVDRLTVEDH